MISEWVWWVTGAVFAPVYVAMSLHLIVKMMRYGYLVGELRFDQDRDKRRI